MKQDIHDPLLRGPLHLSAIAGQESADGCPRRRHRQKVELRAAEEL